MSMDEQLPLLQGFNNSKDVSGAWMEHLYSNMRHSKAWYENEIKKLKAEITTLEDEIKKDNVETARNDVLEKLLTRLPKDMPPLLEDLDVNGKHKAGGDINIEWLKHFTGLCFDSVAVTVDKITADNTRRKYYLVGSCHDVHFEVTFFVEESGSEEDVEESLSVDQSPKITDLNIKIKDELAYFDMKDALRDVQEQQELQQFFSIMESYSKLRRDRVRTFRHFSEKYTDLVALPSHNQTILTICNPKYPAIRVNIVWKIVVTKQGQTSIKFDMLSCIPTQLHKEDRTGLLKSLKGKFNNMLKVIGIEKSIDVIVNVLAKS